MWVGLEPDVLIKLGLAVLYGGAIGLEREARGRAAGLRTVILVCLGSTLIMIVSGELMQPDVGETQRAIIRVDPSRIAAGIVTGIGFLGAAVVVKLGDLVRGVTTAASIWFAAALGIVIGQGYFVLATLATFTALMVLWVFNFPEKVINSPIYRVVTVTTGTDQATPVDDYVRAWFDQHSVRLMDVKAREDLQRAVTELIFHVRCPHDFQALDMIKALRGVDGVRAARWE